MSSSYSGAPSAIIGQAEQVAQATKTAATANKTSLGKDDFLKLLVTQMKTQDPLNPMDDKDYVAQLAQFSSLEQLTNINTGVTSMNTALGQQTQLTAVGFIGKEVKSNGYTLSKTGSTVSALSYTLPSQAADVTMNILDSTGNIVRTVDLGAKQAGEQQFQWDGKGDSGVTLADGQYAVGITAKDATGNGMMVTSSVTGTVTGTAMNNGVFQLMLSDGRTVNFTDVQEVVNPATQSTSTN